jgi:hypothetical protein
MWQKHPRANAGHAQMAKDRHPDQSRVQRGAVEDLSWCDIQKGNTAAAIPVLEKKLEASGFSLPKEFKP